MFSMRRSYFVVISYVLTIFLSSFLLFFVQPMVAKYILPFFGGVPSVWNSCMVFYQAILLFGYLYAHMLSKIKSIKTQYIIHISLLLLSLVSMPVVFDYIPSQDLGTSPIWQVVVCLGVLIAVPFFVVSTTSPLLQKWFGYASSESPYFLYVASNAGSMLALVGYLAYFEPSYKLAEQTQIWSWQYCILMLLLALSGVFALKSKDNDASLEEHDDEKAPSWGLKIKWLLLAFCPSSLMLGVTTYITTDIASVPLLWMVPLIGYLVSFMIVFSRYGNSIHDFMERNFAFLFVIFIGYMLSSLVVNAFLAISALLLFFSVAVYCHGKMAFTKPGTRYLTDFYLIMSIGGVLGGIFNSILAPVLFTNVLELPIVLIVMLLLRVDNWKKLFNTKHAFIKDLSIAILLALMYALFALAEKKISSLIDISINIYGLLLTCFLFAAHSFQHKSLRFALSVYALFLASCNFYTPLGVSIFRTSEATMLEERNFFGVKRVYDAEKNGMKFHVLSNGSTRHGIQNLTYGEEKIPLSYYSFASPVGDFLMKNGSLSDGWKVGAVGLGAGSLVCYARENQEWTFYEIDKQVVDIASDPKYFTYISKCLPDVNIVLGDARLSLKKEADNKFDILIFDAFSSDSVPIHLLTDEAFQLYVKKLKTDGAMLFHLSNRYMKLQDIVMNIANKHGFVSVYGKDESDNYMEGATRSEWVLVTRNPLYLNNLNRGGKLWRKYQPTSSVVWYDDYSNILSALKVLHD